MVSPSAPSDTGCDAGRTLPAGGHLQADVRGRRPLRVVLDGDADVLAAVHAGGDLQRHDHHRRLDVQREAGDDVQLHALLACREIARVAVLHRHLVRHGDALDVELEPRAERRRTERESVRRIRLELGASGVGQAHPVRVGQFRVRRDLHVRRTAEVRRVLDRTRRARRVPVEAGELHALDGHVFRTAVGDVRRHADRLVAHDDAVVGDDVDSQPVRNHDRLLELVFLLRQAEVDLVLADVGQPHGAEARAQRAHRGEAGQQIRAACSPDPATLETLSAH